MQSGQIVISGKWWYLRVWENVTENGTTVRKRMYHKLAKVADYRPSSNKQAPAAVQAMADEIVAPINSGKKQGLSADSMRSALEAYIQAGIGANGRAVRKITQRSMKRDYNVIKNFIPDMPLRNVRTMHINQIFRDLLKDDGDDIRATSAYRNVRNFLSGAFRDAVGKGLVEFNPVRDAMVLSGNDADTHATTLEEFHELMNVLKDIDEYHTVRAAFTLAMFTGLRLEEIKGLKWEDYDKAAGVLNVKRTVVHHIIVEDTKTKSSKAPSVVVKTVAKELEEHLKRNTGDGFIFHKKSSSQSPVILEEIIQEQVHPACTKADIKFHGMHAFRRGISTLLHAQKTDELTIQHILRHSRKSAKTVAGRNYIKEDLPLMREEVEKIEAAYLKLAKRKTRS